MRTPRVCVLRGVLCVRTRLCVFLSGAGVQPFISGVDCRLGEHSDLTAPLFNSHTSCFFVDFFFKTHWTFAHQSGTVSLLSFCPQGTIPIIGINQDCSFTQLSENIFCRSFNLPHTYLPIPGPSTCSQTKLFCAFCLNLDMHQPENGCFASTYQELSESV